MDDLVMTGATAEELWPLVRDFHYSKRQPSSPIHAFALREAGGLFGDTGKPVAGVFYSQPVSRNLPQNALELSRLIRTNSYTGQLSQFFAWTLRWLKNNCDKEFALAYADSTQGHHGGIYQACNFKYVGAFESGHIGYNCPDGSFVHRRACNSRFGVGGQSDMARIKPDWVPVFGDPKHLYIFPLGMKWKKIANAYGWDDLPYPKPDRD
jgi:hypothetical protein